MNLQKSILQTIAFFDLFDFPLTAEEIKEYLYKYDKAVHIKEIKGTLEEMEEVEKIHDYYVLKGRGKLVDVRKTRKFIAEKFWGRTRQYGQYMVRVPFVRMVAVCNNLAYDNPTELSDIDLFIVIEKGRMWLARFIITLILQFHGVRRHGDKIAGRFCLSFFVAPEKMDMEPLLLKPDDPYMAYWTRLLTPIYGKKAYQQFIEDNQWLSEKYGLKFPDINEKKFSFQTTSRGKRFWEWVFKGWFGNLIEALLKKTFKKRTLKKAQKLGPEASVVVSDEMLKFHNKDRREEYRDEWKKRF
ncbi:hypothetical protein JW752_01615 [Candidatus Peregrinibacteria bacterium]|nr:hypothetical protein [Candidatus Peregrinibacteria bacterium]